MKKNRRRLKLNRETILNLDAGTLPLAAGGSDSVILWQCETGPHSGGATACGDTNPSGGDTSVGCGTASVGCPTTGTTFHTN